VSEQDASAVELRKIANLLALRQVADLKKGDAAVILNLSGFSNKEIATLLGTSEGSVRGLISVARKGRNGESKPSGD
jgi:DNA-directed RNA polymerase specialized sigma24 family protein